MPPEPPKVERPEPAAHLGNQNAALRMFTHALHDRAGFAGASSGGAETGSVWMHQRSRRLDGRDIRGQIDLDSRVDSVMLGAGHGFDVAGGQWQLGILGGYGRARGDGRSRLSGYRARGEVSGTTVGAYATWLQAADDHAHAYVDSWLQYGRFRNSVQGDGLERERYRSRSWTGSIEAGYPVLLVQGEQRSLQLQPQVQLIHAWYAADRVIERNGTGVETRRAGGPTVRIGTRLYSQPTGARQVGIQPFMAVNWWSGGNSSIIAVDGESLRRDLPRNIYEVKLGAQLNLSGQWRGSGQVGHQRAAQDYRDTSLQFTLARDW